MPLCPNYHYQGPPIVKSGISKIAIAATKLVNAKILVQKKDWKRQIFSLTGHIDRRNRGVMSKLSVARRNPLFDRRPQQAIDKFHPRYQTANRYKLIKNGTLAIEGLGLSLGIGFTVGFWVGAGLGYENFFFFWEIGLKEIFWKKAN